MENVYVETSIPSYLVARPSRNIIVAARQQLTLEWWETQREQYDLCISNAVIAEAAQGDAVRAAERLAVVQDGVTPLLWTMLDFLRNASAPSIFHS